MADLINTTEVVNQYGEYYEASPDRMQRLNSTLMQRSITPGFARPILTTDTVLRNVTADLGEVVQNYQDKFTAKGKETFTPNPLTLRNLKIDWSGNPHKLINSYLGFLTNDDVQEEEWPFIRWMLEERLIPASQRDREKKVYGKGKYVAATSGTASAAKDSMDGIIEIAKKSVNDGNGINLNLDAPITAANALDSFEALSDQLPEEWESEDVLFLSDPKFVKWYFRDDRNTNGGNNNYNGANPVIQFSDLMDGGERLASLPSLSGTGIIIPCIADNFIHARGAGMTKPFEVEKYQREVSIYTDWWEAIGFEVQELVAYFDNNDYSNSTSAV